MIAHEGGESPLARGRHHCPRACRALRARHARARRGAEHAKEFVTEKLVRRGPRTVSQTTIHQCIADDQDGKT